MLFTISALWGMQCAVALRSCDEHIASWSAAELHFYNYISVYFHGKMEKSVFVQKLHKWPKMKANTFVDAKNISFFIDGTNLKSFKGFNLLDKRGLIHLGRKCCFIQGNNIGSPRFNYASLMGVFLLIWEVLDLSAPLSVRTRVVISKRGFLFYIDKNGLAPGLSWILMGNNKITHPLLLPVVDVSGFL